MILTPNLVIADRFQLQRPIGRGGMGSVWLARHLGLDIPCAVKFIEGNYATMPEAQARFVREAKAAAQLRSPHVVQILDHGVWQGTPYMAMELLEGEDLGKRIARLGRVPFAEVVRIINEVARALTKAHAAGIVHRDLKPDNIFLVRDDDREIAKVLDFGIAKANSALDGGNTKTGAMLGTPYYMSPEQAQGVKAVDHRSDLWSLGVIVYLAVTGRLPFESEALGDLLMRIIVQPIPVPSHVAPDLPPAFDRWWAKASSRDPSQRYASAKEMADALAVVLGQSLPTEVSDRSDIRAALAGGAPRPPAGAPPWAQTPNPGGPPGPATMPVTPAPYPTPQPYGQQGQPSAGMQAAGLGGSGGLGASGSSPMVTGAPIAHTFGGAPAPKSRAGLFIGLSAGVVLLSVLVIGAAMMMKPKPTVAAAPPAAESVPAATAAATAPSAAPPPAAPSASEIASAAPPETLTPPAETKPVVRATPGAGMGASPVASPNPGPGARPRPPAPGITPAAPSRPAAPKKHDADLGI